jgi:hypothetical protein
MRKSARRIAILTWLAVLVLVVIGCTGGEKFRRAGLAEKGVQAGRARKFATSVDPRMELLGVVQHFTSWAPGGHIKSQTAYKDDIDDYFGEFRNHRAVVCMESLVGAGFTHDAPVRLMLHHEDPPDLVQHTPYSDYLIERAGGEEALTSCLDALRDFARETDFVAFYHAHDSVYSVHVEEVETLLTGKEYVRALEEFFGESQSGYHIILPPLFAGGYGPAIRRERGWELYAVIGPCALQGERVTFACLDYLESIMLHEWSHSFVNPLVDQHYDLFRKSEGLYAPIQGMMTSQAYPTWRIALYEHVVRASEINIRAILYDDFDKDEALQVQEGKGFWYVSYIDSLLGLYQTHRENYPTSGDFMPRIATALGELSVDELPERITAFGGPLSGVFPRARCIYLVCPTAVDEELARGIDQELEGFTQFPSSFGMESQIVSDAEALEMTWVDKVAFVYGNTDNNAFLRQFDMAIPLRFRGNAMEFGDERFEGEGMLLISCMPNPFNTRLPFVVCAANRSEDLVGIGMRVSSPSEWDADYVLYRGDERLVLGRYRKEGGEWSLSERGPDASQ